MAAWVWRRISGRPRRRASVSAKVSSARPRPRPWSAGATATLLTTRWSPASTRTIEDARPPSPSSRTHCSPRAIRAAWSSSIGAGRRPTASTCRPNAASTSAATAAASSSRARRKAHHAVVLELLHVPALQQQVDVTEHLRQREERLRHRDVAPHHLSDLEPGLRPVGQDPGDLRRAPLVALEPVVDQRAMVLDDVAV